MEELKALLARKKEILANEWTETNHAAHIRWLMDMAEWQARLSVGALEIANINSRSQHYDIKRLERKL